VLSLWQLGYQDCPGCLFAELAAPALESVRLGKLIRRLYPERAMHVNGRIELEGGQSLLQLGPWLQCGLVLSCAGGKPADHGAWLDFVC